MRTQVEQLRQQERKIKVQNKQIEMLWEEMNNKNRDKASSGAALQEDEQKKQIDTLWGEMLKRFEAMNVVKQTSESKKATRAADEDEEVFLSNCEKSNSHEQRVSGSSSRSSTHDKDYGNRASVGEDGAQVPEEDTFAADAVLLLSQGQSKNLLTNIVNTMSNVDLVESRTISYEETKRIESERNQDEQDDLDELFSELGDTTLHQDDSKNQKTLSLDLDDESSKTSQRRASWKLALGDVKESSFQALRGKAVGGMPVDQCLIEDMRGALDILEEENSDAGSVFGGTQRASQLSFGGSQFV